jgi:GNAT superfamily N-acetyltransferase
MTSARPAVTIRRALRFDAEQLAVLLAEAFLIAPVGDWLIPDVDIRRAVYLNYFPIFVEHALDHGLIHVTQDLSGAALWYPRTTPIPDRVDYDARLLAACGPWLRRFIQLDITFARHHPIVPHHHLAFLAVAPERQSAGIGSELLNHHHANLEAEGVPAYLEASNARNRDLYLRHGYQAGAPFRLPDDGPPLWPMWRTQAFSKRR